MREIWQLNPLFIRVPEPQREAVGTVCAHGLTRVYAAAQARPVGGVLGIRP